MMPKAAHIIFSVLLLGCGARAFLSPKLETARRFHRLHAPQKLLSTLTQDVTDTPVGMELEPEKMNEKFNWFKACYPIVPVEILDAEVPHKFQLLGMDLVVWNDAPVQGGAFGPKKNRPKKAHRSTSGEWRAFVDECPHRKVPLSEGRVEDDGSLLCSYHAWRFDGQGALVDIPQLDKEEEEFHRIQANSKSSCNAFPTQVIDDVLWVWPESGSDARLEAALKEPPLCKTTENVEPDRLFIGKWNFRELPYSADYFIKNVVDPAHVQVRYVRKSVATEQCQGLTGTIISLACLHIIMARYVLFNTDQSSQYCWISVQRPKNEGIL
jgi:nitrite reductase/ring-hydroxylating ferredoxin subunit